MNQVVPHIQVIKLHPVSSIEGTVAVRGEVTDAVGGARRWRRWAVYAVLFLPAVVVALYAILFAADRYVSETKFFIRSVRSAQGSIASAVSDASAGRSPADSHAVREFLLSRDALTKLEQEGLVTRTLASAGFDLLWRYPMPLSAPTIERLYRYYQSLISVQYDTTTGIITMRMEAFSPESAKLMSQALARHSEALLNTMELRSKAAAVTAARTQVNLANERSASGIEKLRLFRERQLVVDPVKQSEGLFATISKLYLAQSEANARLRVLLRTAPNSPEINSIRTTIAALGDQITAERASIAGTATALAPVIAEFETLSMENEFATRFLISALVELEAAEQDNRKQFLFLETVSGPSLPDFAAYPWRTLIVLLAFVINGILVFLVRVTMNDVFEHADQ